jgi:hypothetical protein
MPMGMLGWLWFDEADAKMLGILACVALVGWTVERWRAWRAKK